MLRKLFSICCLICAGTLSAAPADFSMCEGLTGAEWGICRAGAAAGCADGTGNASACDEIESTYTSVSGSPPPWIEPPVECPCDYSLVPTDQEYWIEGLISDDIWFRCGFDEALVYSEHRQIGDSVFKTLNAVWVGLRLEGPTPDERLCQAMVSSEILTEFPVTIEEQDACRASVIELGQALKALYPDHVDDECTPTL